MKGLKNIHIKLYYRFWYLILPKKILNVPESLKATKNIFLYFDYEREFSGHKTEVTDKDIICLIKILNNYYFKCTWFTVGQIFKKYPETINEIINSQHELASHTFNHYPPLQTSCCKLKKDFELVENDAPLKIRGFHSPNGRWSLSLIKYLKKHHYFYDVISEPKVVSYSPFRHQFIGYNKLIRLQAVNDDWVLFCNNYNEEEVFEYFKSLYNKVGVGEIGGIGLHPWVLYSDRRIINGFLKFLDYLKEQPNIKIDTAKNYAKLLEEENK